MQGVLVKAQMAQLTEAERNILQKLQAESEDYVDNTSGIREAKHSSPLLADIRKMGDLRKRYANLRESAPDEYLNAFQRECRYIYTKFPDVFDRVVKNDMNLDVFEKIVMILKMIEDGKVNQSEASALVGKLSQKLFFNVGDAGEAVKPSSKTEPADETTTGLSWKEYKRSQQQK
jgi:hypothetical protein